MMEVTSAPLTLWTVNGLATTPKAVLSRAVKELEANQDYPKSNRWNPEKIQKMIEQWNGS